MGGNKNGQCGAKQCFILHQGADPVTQGFPRVKVTQ